MRKFIFLTIVFTLISLSLYSQDHGELQKATISVAAEVGKSVVSISSVIKEKVSQRRQFGSPFGGSHGDPFGGFFEEFFGTLPQREYKRAGLGSGVIIDKDGYILTNDHVISGATEIKVKLSDGREFDAKVKGTDGRSDLAIIKIDAQSLPAVKLGDSDKLCIGEWVVAIGNPFGFAIENPEPTVTVGVISALRRYIPALGAREKDYDDLIQTDAAINPGNSGGPLVNLDGEVVGVNTAIITTSGGYQGLGFAIPANKAKRILNKLIKGEEILYGWLGASIQDLNEDLRNYFGVKEKEGVIIVKIFKGSPADKAKLKEGDLILKFDNKSVKTTRDLVRMVSFSEADKILPVEAIRDGKKMIVSVKIGKRPKDLEGLEELGVEGGVTFRGMKVEDLTATHKQRFRLRGIEGVVITYIEDDSSAQRCGLQVGDVITKIEQKEVKNSQDFVSITSEIKGPCLLKTNRGYIVLKDVDG